MGQRVVGGQPGRAAADERAARPEFVGEATGVGAHRGVGDQPALHVTALGAEGRQAADHAVQRQPVQALSKFALMISSLSTGRRSSNRSKSCQTYADDPFSRCACRSARPGSLQ